MSEIKSHLFSKGKDMKLKIYLSLGVFVLIACLAACTATPVKILDLKDVCNALPDMRDAGGGLKEVVVEGYITGRELNPNGVTVEGDKSIRIYIAEETNSSTEKTVGAKIEMGDKNNQIQMLDNGGYKIRDDKGEILKSGDKVRVYLSLGNTKYQSYSICSAIVVKITKL